MGENDNNISNIIGDLKEELDKLIIANPYILKVLSKTYKNKAIEDYDQLYKKFKKYDIIKKIIYIVLGFIICLVVLAFSYYLNNINVLPSYQGEPQKVLSSLLPAIPIIFGLISIFLGFWAMALRTVVLKDLFTTHFWAYLLLYIVIGIILPIASIHNNELLLNLCPLFCCIVIVSSMYFIHSPLSSRKLNNTIIEKTKLIQKNLDSLNKSMVQSSHARVLEQIGKAQNEILNKNNEGLSKIQSLTVLDSLRLELIQNSMNGINLVEDWKYLDLSQKMIEDIMSSHNKKITMLGDLSFLSTIDGVKQLVRAIEKEDKSFSIYFTGEIKEGYPNAIFSQHCQDLVNNIKVLYFSEDKKQLLKKIQNNLHLFPIPIQYFTGIGFIGLIKDDEDPIIKRYEKVYAYISSHLIAENGLDITRANPFVFSWGSNKAFYFEEFMKYLGASITDLKVIIDNKPKGKSELLTFD